MSVESLRRRLLGAGLLCGLATAPGAGVAGPLALDPQTACAALAEQGLAARGGYRPIDGHRRCTSARKPLAAGGTALHEIRFFAEGDEGAVHRLVLELALRSREDIQRAHRLLARYAATLTGRLLQAPLPAPVDEAILSGTGGRWSVAGRAYDLRRNTAGAGLYELRLVIE